MKNNINELREKIISNAEEEAEVLLSRAQKAKERVLKQAKEEEEKIKKEAEERGKLLFEKEKSRIVSKKKMNDKKEFFTLRKQLFELLHTDLEKKLISMLKKSELDNWIKSCCEEVLKIEKEASFVADKEYIGNFKKICKGIEGLNFESEAIEAGFLIRGRDDEYDFRFFLIAGNILRQNMKIIADKLGVSDG